MKTNKSLFIAFLLFTRVVCLADAPVQKGQLLFSARCSSCHNIKKDLTGPSLAGIEQRRPMEWIVRFVHSPQTLIKSNDPYALTLFNKFNKVIMPDHRDLQDQDIKDVIEYIKSESKQASEVKAPAFSGKRRPTYEPLSLTDDYLFFISYMAFVMVLIGVMILAVHVKSIQRARMNNL